ncbi:MAG: L-2-amino-thiazoline-4-carboxylic acid hydrolase [Desulfobacterales bacterium]
MPKRPPDPEAAIERAFDRLPSDDLNARVGVLVRREIEARILVPLLAGLEARFGREAVAGILNRMIAAAARRQGNELARQVGGRSLAEFRRAMEPWMRGGALEVKPLEEGETVWAYRVTRCRYAEMYRGLGIPALGVLLSCARDAPLASGFNPAIRLERGPTILEGAAACDFRYRLAP